MMNGIDAKLKPSEVPGAPVAQCMHAGVPDLQRPTDMLFICMVICSHMNMSVVATDAGTESEKI